MGFLDNTGLAHLWEKITSALSKKQNSPYVFGVLYDTSNETYTVTTAPATVQEFMSIYQDRELDLEIYDWDMTRARYYRCELYLLQGNAFGLLFKDIQPDINMQSYNITGAHSAGFGLAGIVSSEDYTITWQALDLGNRDLANASDIPSLLSDLADDAQHRLVTDSEKAAWSAKLDTTGNAYRTASIPFAQVDDTSTSTVFTATVPGITELRSGVCVFLMNGVVTSASGFTININGLGAKPVYSTLSAASRSTTLFNVAYTLFLVYNEERVSGGCWDAYYGYDSNTNTIGYQLRTNSTTMPALDKFYRYRLLFTAADRQHFVPANTSSSTSADTAKTTTQRPIDPFGAIYYYGHTTAINANANPTASYFWTQYSFALGYSFNRTGAALTLTNHAPVYIKCAPQSDGSAIIDADDPFVQTLPSTADGKIYIFLGIASSATAVELVPEHPVFCYRNGQIRLWTGNAESFQTQSITDTGGYYTTDTVEGALQEIGAELTGVNTLIGSGVIT